MVVLEKYETESNRRQEEESFLNHCSGHIKSRAIGGFCEDCFGKGQQARIEIVMLTKSLLQFVGGDNILL